MNSLYFLVGTLALLIALVFFGFLVLLWGLRELIIIRQQNDNVIALLQQMHVTAWHDAPIPLGLQENLWEAPLPSDPEGPVKVYRPAEPVLTDAGFQEAG